MSIGGCPYWPDCGHRGAAGMRACNGTERDERMMLAFEKVKIERGTPLPEMAGRMFHIGWYAAMKAADAERIANTTVLVREVSQYGVMVLHPANALAHNLCQMAGAKTVTLRTIASAKALGFIVMTTGESPRSL